MFFDGGYCWWQINHMWRLRCSSCGFNRVVISPVERQFLFREQRNPSYYNGLWPSKVPLYMTRYICPTKISRKRRGDQKGKEKKCLKTPFGGMMIEKWLRNIGLALPNIFRTMVGMSRYSCLVLFSLSNFLRLKQLKCQVSDFFFFFNGSSGLRVPSWPT